MKTKKYQIVSGLHEHGVANEVEDELSKGWELWGHLQVGGLDGRPWYAQCMVKQVAE